MSRGQSPATRGVDVLCCEAGLGGRLDASNALPARATLLTSVGLDHQAILGETREAIAAEKLGLLKRGRAALLRASTPTCGRRSSRAAVHAGSPCHFLDELAAGRTRTPERGGTWDLTLRDRVLRGLAGPGRAGPAPQRGPGAAGAGAAGRPRRANALLPRGSGRGAAGSFPARAVPDWCCADPDWIVDTAHNAQALDAALAPSRRARAAAGASCCSARCTTRTCRPRLGRLLRGCGVVARAGRAAALARSRDELAALFDGWGLSAQAGGLRAAAGLPAGRRPAGGAAAAGRRP